MRGDQDLRGWTRDRLFKESLNPKEFGAEELLQNVQASRDGCCIFCAHMEGSDEDRWFEIRSRVIESGSGSSQRVDSFSEVTDWKKLLDLEGREKRIREIFLNSIADEISDPIFARDGHGNYFLANKAAVKSLQKSRQEIIGSNSGALFGSDLARQFAQSDHIAMVNKEPCKIERKIVYGGTLVNYMATKIPCQMGEESIGMAIIVRDLSESLREEEDRKQADRMASIGRLAAVVAHEINNPLAGIKTSFQVIKEDFPADHSLVGFIDRIDREIDRIANIVRQMYGLYRPDQDSILDFSLQGTIEDVALVMRGKCQERGVTLRLDMPEEEIHIESMESLLRQVLFNLIVNAADASPHDEEVVVVVAPDGSNVSISVIDRGEGISPDLRTMIFEPLFTTKTGQGEHNLGLGLSTVKTIADSLGGEINLKDADGGGSVFEFLVPRKHPDGSRGEEI